MFLAVISSIFNIFQFSLKIWNPDNFVYLGMQCREILRIFRGRVFEIYVILTFFHHFFKKYKKIQNFISCVFFVFLLRSPVRNFRSLAATMRQEIFLKPKIAKFDPFFLIFDPWTSTLETDIPTPTRYY